VTLRSGVGKETRDLSRGGDVGEVGGDTGGVDDIVQAQFSDDRVELEQQGQGLSDSTGSTCDDSFDHF